MHAAKLVRAFQALAEANFWGMGGPLTAEAGVELLVDCRELGFIGFIDVILHYRKIMRELEKLRAAMRQRKPDLVILVDYPGLNMKVAQTAQELGIPVLYYISPQIWAWRPQRIHEIAERVNMMAVIFPFEVPIYARAGIPVRFVGHPLVDEVHSNLTKTEAVESLGLRSDLPTLGLLPGSRPGEIKRMLGTIAQSAEILMDRFGELNLLLPIAPTLDEAAVNTHLQGLDAPIKLLKNRTYDALRACDAVISSSGTATLETAIMGVPMAIIYKVSWLNYRLMKRLITVDDIGLANIVAGKRIVQEFVQDAAKPQDISAEIQRILENQSYRAEMQAALAEVKTKLGEGGGSEQVAKLALEMLHS